MDRLEQSNQERQWVHAIRHGDVGSFEELFSACYAPLCSFAARYVHDGFVAEEIVQGLFCKIWERRERLDDSGSIRAYLYRAVRNEALKHRQRVEPRRQSLEPVTSHYADPSPDPEDDLSCLEFEKALERVLAELPERRRTVFDLSRTHGLTYREIAEMLGISIKTVETQMSRTLRHLERRLADFL